MTNLKEIKKQGAVAYTAGASCFDLNPYYPGSYQSDAFVEGWEEEEWRQVSKGCPWGAHGICDIGKRLCAHESCGVWFFIKKMEEK